MYSAEQMALARHKTVEVKGRAIKAARRALLHAENGRAACAAGRVNVADERFEDVAAIMEELIAALQAP